MGASGPGRAALASVSLALALGACQLAPPRVHNLTEVHQPDGRPKRDARLLSDIGYLLDRGLRSTNYGGETPLVAGEAKRIKDPLGKCLENVCALARCERDEKVAGLQAATFAWLAVECTNPLSRERCLLSLGELAPLLPEDDSPPARAAGEPGTPVATADEVKEAFETLVATTREVVAAPALAGNALPQAVERVRALNLDRSGAVRLLRAVNTLLAEGEHGAVRAPLRELRLVLSRRATELALRAALADTNGRVRAAAFEACLRAFPAERAERLSWALSDPMEGLADREALTLRALELIAEHGLPPVGLPGYEQALRGRVLDVLARRQGGPLSVAACRALAKIEERPQSLRPETWLALWPTRGAGREEAAGATP